jgi:alpha-galactosidase
MRTKITLLGAGSGFTRPLFTDMLAIQDLDEATIGLVDIDAKRLDVNVKLLRRLIEVTGRKGWTIDASTDRRKVLPGTSYLISTIEVSGTACVRFDNDIPLKYGIDQCIGDTIGPGGIMKALRTLPPFLQILADARELCPNALVMNYTNPMSIMTLGATRFSSQPFVGLCHSVQGTSKHIANMLGIPYDEMRWRCGGVNHMAWFTELSWKGIDLYPELRHAMEDPAIYERDPVRFDIMKHFGYFVTESSGHFSEYVPYYRKRKDLLTLHCRDRYLGGSSFYADNWPTWRKDCDQRNRDFASGKTPLPTARGHEYAAGIVEAHLFDRRTLIHASVPNTGLITNLPQNGVVEVGVVVDREGYTPTYFGALPEQVAALCRSNMAVFELTAQGVLSGDREAIIHAMMVDPLTAAVCSPAEVRAMAEELFAVERAFIPAWTQAPKRVPAFRSQLPKRAAAGAKDGAAAVSDMAARNVVKSRRSRAK